MPIWWPGEAEGELVMSSDSKLVCLQGGHWLRLSVTSALSFGAPQPLDLAQLFGGWEALKADLVLEY